MMRPDWTSPDGSIQLYHADCLAVLPQLEPGSVDAVVTDPPYGLDFMGKDWDHGIPGVHFWEAALRAAKPGAHLLAFGGTRTHHRLMVAIEDAGWEIRDTIFWCFGSGFPKSKNIGCKCGGGTVSYTHDEKTKQTTECDLHLVRDTDVSQAVDSSQGRTQESGEICPKCGGLLNWVGYGTALKPAYELIIVARKPLNGTVAANVLKYGTGGINIDGCRIAAEDGEDRSRDNSTCDPDPFFRHKKRINQVIPPGLGRWPANLIHDGSDEVLAGFPEVSSGAIRAEVQAAKFGTNGIYGKGNGGEEHAYQGNSGSAARFFYCAKASKEDRDEGCEGLEEVAAEGFDASDGGYNVRTWIDRKDGKGKVPVDAKRQPRRNSHPTVKPTDLMRYLCRLVTSPGGIILDPFMGSGSTGKACIKENFRFIGIENDTEHGYFAIAVKRIEAELNRFPLLEPKQPRQASMLEDGNG
jgi:site-specific DNA-methyltransferase (adenine-specific)